MEDQNRVGDGRRGGGPPPGGRKRRRRRRRGRGPDENGLEQGGPRPAENGRGGAIRPFDLFCALHLGITPHNTFRPTNLAQVARRFNTTPEAIRALLTRYALDTPDLARARFDIGLAQLDMQVLPDGIDRTEQARMLWEDLLDASPATRRAVEQSTGGYAGAADEDEEGDDEDLGDDEDPDDADGDARGGRGEGAHATAEAPASPARRAGARPTDADGSTDDPAP
ncbi:hypothetical protein L6R50_00340 [Myxococcota bacterium]|nr:hypothetical protein [Myxococcota bacterium]